MENDGATSVLFSSLRTFPITPPRITSTSLCMHYSLKMYVNAIENLVSLCVVFPKLPSTRLGKGENEC